MHCLFYQVWLGQFSSSQPKWCCVLDLWPNRTDNTPLLAELCLHSLKAFSVSHFAPPMSSLGMGKRLEGDRASKADLNWQKDIPCPRTSCSTIKLASCSAYTLWRGVFPSKLLHRDWLGIGLLVGGGEWLTAFASLVVVRFFPFLFFFPVLIKMPPSRQMNFSRFCLCLSDSVLHLAVGH